MPVLKVKHLYMMVLILTLSSNTKFDTEEIRNQVLESFHFSIALFLNEHRYFPGEAENPLLYQLNLEKRYLHIVEMLESSTENDLYFLVEELALPNRGFKALEELVMACHQRSRIRKLIDILKPQVNQAQFGNNALLGTSLAILVCDQEISITRSPDLTFLRDWLRITFQTLISLKNYLVALRLTRANDEAQKN